MEKILVIEDDRAINKALKHLLESEGFTVDIAPDGAAGLAAFRHSPPSLVILDLKLPKMPGRDLCREFKQASPSLPIIVLSAASDEADKVLLLELGADDYVTKPFSPKELLARVRAVLRRSQRATQVDQYAFDEVSVDFAKMELTLAGKPVALTPQEFRMLKYFILNSERVLSREKLLNEVWGYDCYPTTRTVDTHMLKLRQKLEKDPANPVYFLTVHVVGYKFVPGRILGQK